jgi:hypothetical protein
MIDLLHGVPLVDHPRFLFLLLYQLTNQALQSVNAPFVFLQLSFILFELFLVLNPHPFLNKRRNILAFPYGFALVCEFVSRCVPLLLLRGDLGSRLPLILFHI